MRTLLPIMLLLTIIACASGDEYQAAAAERAALASQPRPAEPGRFEPTPQPRPLAPARFEYGEGNCGPQFDDGTRGTCIAGKPCNGFGFRNAQGSLVCACFEVAGGCPLTQACSIRRRACVARDEIDVQRLPPR